MGKDRTLFLILKPKQCDIYIPILYVLNFIRYGQEK